MRRQARHIQVICNILLQFPSENWVKQCVDWEILVGNTTPQMMLVLDADSSNTLVQVKEQVTKKIANIEQWSDAFLIYNAIYTEQYPAEVPDILKYMQLSAQWHLTPTPVYSYHMIGISESCGHTTQCHGLHYTRSFSSPSANMLLPRTPLSP